MFRLYMFAFLTFTGTLGYIGFQRYSILSESLALKEKKIEVLQLSLYLQCKDAQSALYQKDCEQTYGDGHRIFARLDADKLKAYLQ